MSIDPRHRRRIRRLARCSALALCVAGSWTTLARAGTFSTLYTFSGPDGAYPAGVTGDTAGNLYGTTVYGGTATPYCQEGCGTVFVIDPAGTRTTLSAPDSFSLDFPFNTPTLHGIRLIGATTAFGSGTGGKPLGSVFSVAQTGGPVSDIFTFNGKDGDNPSASTLYQDRTGTIFGATTYGGPSYKFEKVEGDGTLFELTPNGFLTTLHDFGGTDGSAPNGIVLVGTTLYGTTYEGGTCTLSGGCGTVFSLDLANNDTLTTLYDFTAFAAPMIAGVDADGDIFGATQAGGTSNYGTLFELRLVGGVYQYELLHSFNFQEGSPESAPRLTTDGALIGVTSGGEQYSHAIGGLLYQYYLPGQSLKTLHVFPSNAEPQSTPYIDTAKTIYGTTFRGGNQSCEAAFGETNGCGTVYEYTR